MARSRRTKPRTDPVRLVGLLRRTRSALLVSTALQATAVMVLALPVSAQPAPNAQPMGGVVVGGTASISQSATATTINQATQRGAINWQSFNVGARQSVTFEQPNAQAVTLNTVQGANPSQVAGKISANGQIILVNPNGVTFYKGSQVNTAGLMVSAASTDPKAFMAGGNVAFDKAGNPNAHIINNGHITISGAGLASLVAPSVANAGVIDAKLGRVVLAGGTTSTLDLYGDKLVSVNVTGSVTQAPDGGEALVTNTGVVRADGGTVRLTARAVDGVVTNLVSAGGHIRANSVGSRQGRITIDAMGGSIVIDGDVEATGNAAGTTGGRIGALASGTVTVRSGATLNASGAAGGGVIAVGTTLNRAAGGPTVTGARMSHAVLVQSGATIAANATTAGRGGHIAVLSSDSTTMSGLVSATGGAASGDGGFVEVSGGALSLFGSVNVGAVHGASGLILMDPTNVTVISGGGTLDSLVSNGTLLASADDTPPDTVSVSKLTGNVLLQALQKLEVASSVTGASSLTLEAGGTIIVDHGVTINTAGNVILATGGAGPFTPPAAQSSPTISVLGTINSTGGSVTMLSGQGGGIGIGSSGTVIAGGAGQLVSLQTDALSIANNGGISAATIEIAPASSLGITLGGAGGSGGLSLSRTTIGGLTADTLRLGGITSGGPIAQTATGIAIAGATDLGAFTTVDLQSTGAVTQTAALVNVSRLTGNTGTVALTNSANQISGIGGYTVGSGGFTLTTELGLAVSGPVSAANIVLTSTGTSSAVSLAVNASLSAVSGGTVSVQADQFTVAGGASVSGGTFEFAPSAPSVLSLGTGGNLVSLTGVGAPNITLGAVNGTTVATGITNLSTFDLSNNGNARALDLEATGGVSDGRTSPFVNVSTLTGNVSGGSVFLTNGITNVGTFTVTGSNDIFSLLRTSIGTLTVSGLLSAPSVALSAPQIQIAGSIDTGGASAGNVSLVTSRGAVGGAGAITTGTLSGSVVGAFDLTGTQQIGALGTLTAASITLNDGVALTIVGSVGATNGVSLTSGDVLTVGTAGTVSGTAVMLSGTDIAIAGLVTDGGSGTVNLVATTGSIAEPGTIVSGTLSGSAGASAVMSGTSTSANQIANLGSFTAHGSLTLNDGTALNINSNVSAAGAISLNSTDVLTVNTAVAVTGGLVTLNGSSLQLFGAVSDGGSGTVDLIASTGSITQSGGTVVAGTLNSNSANSIDLSSNANNLTNLGLVSATGSIAVRDSVALNIANTVSAHGTNNISLNSGGLLAINSGQTVAAAGVNLTGAAVAISGLINSAGTVGLIANVSTISELGTINAGVLTGSSSGSAILAGASASANQIGTVGAFTVTAGTIVLNDGMSLTIVGQVSAGAGDVALRSAGSGNTITVGNTGTLAAASSGTVSVRADNISVTGNGTVTGGTFEYAQDTSEKLVLGGVGGPSLNGINTGLVRLGATQGTTTATGISLAANFDAGNGGPARALDLQSDGNVVSGNHALLNVTTLSGTVTGGSVDLNSVANTVSHVGSFLVSNGFTFTDSNVLTVNGVLSVTGLSNNGGPVLLTAPTIAVAGSINTGGSLLGAVTLNATGATISGAGVITTGTLSGSAQTSINLSGTNQIGSLGSLTASSIKLNDGVALSIANTVSASGAVSLTSGGLLTVASHQTVTGSNVTLTGSALAITGLVTTAGTVNLIATKSSIGELGTIAANTLTGSSATSATLSGASLSTNQIVNLGAFTATAGTISITDGTPLNVTGVVSSPNGNIVLRSAGASSQVTLTDSGTLAVGSSGTASVRADIFSVAGNGEATGGVFEYAQNKTGPLSVGPGGTIVDLKGIESSLVRLGAVNGVTTATGLTLTGNLDLAGNGGGSRALDLQSTGGISDGGFALLNVSTLSGVASGGSVVLTSGGNDIAALGSFIAQNGLTLLDGRDLKIVGIVSGSPVLLTAPNLNVAGTITTAGNVNDSVTLIANVGTIGETVAGVIDTSTFIGSAIGTATLGGANLIGTLGAFSAAGLTLNDQSSLTVGDDVSVTGLVALTSGGLLKVAFGNTVSGAAVALQGTSVAINGLVTDGGAGSVNLVATTGSITESGTIIAGTLSGGAGTSATILANVSIVALGSFTTGAGLILSNSGALLVDGPVNDTGSTSALVLAAGSGDLTLAGSINARNVLDLFTLGTISQSGGLIAAGTLTGSATAATLTQPNNQIGTLGAFTTTAGFALTDNEALTIAGPVQDTGLTTTLAVTTTRGGLTLSGNVTATNVVDLISAGTIGQTSGSISAAMLEGSAAAAVSLTATGNQIPNLGQFNAPTLDLIDGTSLAIIGNVIVPNGVSITDTGSLTVTGIIASANGDIRLGATSPSGLAVNSGSVLSGDTVSVSAPTLAVTGTGTIIANTFEFNTSININDGTVTLGGGGFSPHGISANTFRVGQVGGTVVAASIVIAGYDNGGLPLQLDATNGVTQTGALTGVTTLSGTASSYQLTDAGNAIGQLGNLATTGGGLIRIDDGTGLTLTGLVNSGVGTVDLSVFNGFGITQSLGSTLIAAVLTSQNGISGGLALQGAGNRIGTISNLIVGTGLTIVNSQALTLAGNVQSKAGSIDITTTGIGSNVTQAANGVMTAPTLTSAGGISGELTLLGTHNAISAIANLSATGITVVDSVNLAFRGAVNVGAGIIDVSTNNGASISQPAGGVLTVGEITSSGSIAGTAVLLGTGNKIGTLTGFSVSGGQLTVVDDPGLTLTGLVSVGTNGTYDYSGPGLNQGTAGTLIAGVVTSSGGITDDVVLLGTANQIGTIANLAATNLVVVDNQSLVLAGLVSVGSTGSVDITTTSGGALTQGAGASLVTGTLTGSGGIPGGVTLLGTANAIGTITDMTVPSLAVVDGATLTLAGTVSVGSSGTVSFSGAGVAQGAGATLIAGVLTSASGLSGNVVLDGTANQIGTVSGLTAGGLAIVDSETLTLAGRVSAGPGGTINITTNSGADLLEGAAGKLIAGVLTSGGGISGEAILQGTANAIGTLGGFTATGSLAVVDGGAMTVAGAVGSSGGDVFLTTGANTLSFAAGGSLASVSGGTISVLADSLGNLGTVGATGVANAGPSGVFEYAPFTPTLTLTLGATLGPSLRTTTGIEAGLVRLGAATHLGGAAPVVSAAAINASGTFDALGDTVELDAKGAITQSAPLVNVATLIGGAASIALTNGGNTIGQIGGGQIGGGTLIASAGSLAIVDAAPLTIAGVVSAPLGNLFVSNGTNTLTFANNASLVSQAGGTIGIQAGGLNNFGNAGATGAVQTTSGLFELAPGGTNGTLTLGATGGLALLDLTGVGAANLRFGAITMPNGTVTTTAGSIAVGGAFDAQSTAVELDATGAVTQTAALLNVATLTGSAGSFTLTDSDNTIAQLGGGPLGGGKLLANAGTLALIDASPMTVAGTVGATSGNVFLQAGTLIFAPGGTLRSVSGGTIGLSTGDIVNLGTAGATGVVRTGAAGVLEIAPIVAMGETLGFASGLSLVDVAGINTGLLRIGAVTMPNGSGPTTVATSIVIAGTFNAGGIPLELDATGAVSQTAALINVSTLTGTAGSFTLTNTANAIGQIGGGTLTASAGTLAIVDSTGLIIAGTINAAAGDVFLQTGAGKTMTFAPGGTVLSVPGGIVGIEADKLANLGTTGATGVVNTGLAGEFELAPNPGTTITLGISTGLLNNLTNITTGTLMAGAVTQPGSGTLTVTAGSINFAGTFDAKNLSVLDLEANGAITQIPNGPIVNIVTLNASTNGAAGDINLGSTLNSVATLGAVSATAGNFTFGDAPLSGLLSVQSGEPIVAQNVSITVIGSLNVTGSITASGPPGNLALIAQGTLADLMIGAGASLVADTVTMTAGRDISQTGGVINAGTVVEMAGGTVSVSATLSAPDITLQGANISLPGFVTNGGAGSLALIATSGTINETGTVAVGTLTGRSTGATTLTGATPTVNQIDTLGSFTAAGFVLNDGTSLAVTGPVNGGPGATITDSALLTISGSLSAAAVSLTSANIAIPGTVTAGTGGTVGLIATGGTINEVGTLIAGTLSGSATGAATLTGSKLAANQVGTLSGFTALGFTLDDGVNLTVAGTVNGGPSATIAGAASLTVGGTVTATAVSLTGSNITIPGLVTDGGSGTVSLIATGGTIGEVGTLIAGTLSGSSTGAANLIGNTPTANLVAVLGDFTAAGFRLNDGNDLSVSGVVKGGVSATILDSGDLSIGGAVSATAISLTGGNLTIIGLVSDGGAGTVSLIATAGTISESGTLIAGSLSGSSTGATSLLGTTPTINQVATLVSFTAAGFDMNDGHALTVTGVLAGGTSATIVDSALLTVSGTVTADAVALTGGNIAIPGEVTDGGIGQVSLIATLGTINETGILIAGTLSGSSPGATTLIGASKTANQVANISSFSANGFTLVDGEALSANPIINGGSLISITDAAGVTINATLSASAISLNGQDIAIGGLVTAGGAGSVTLVATSGAITETGIIVAGTLSGSSGGATTLTGNNQISSIGSFTAAGFMLNDGAALSVGIVNGGSGATITDTAALTVQGGITASSIALTASSIDIPGVVDGGGGPVVLIANGGGITETGVLIAGTLSGQSSGSTSLTGANPSANQVATLGSFIANGFTLDDGVALVVSGVVLGGNAATIAGTSSLSITGTVSATAISLTDASISIEGLVTDGGAGSVTLVATGGGISETGALIAGTLTGSSTGATTLTGTANQVATLGSFTAAGFDLNDGVSLAVTGEVIGGTGATIVDTGDLSISGGISASVIALTGLTISIPGVVSDGGAGSVTLVATGGGITEAGTLIAGTLSGSATGTASLNGAGAVSNQVGTLGDFTAAGFVLNDGEALFVAGDVIGGSGATITDTGALTIGGTVSAAAIALTASDITIPGAVVDPSGGMVSLIATNGTINETGLLIAGTLSGSSTGATSLTGAGNQVASISTFTANGFTLNNGVALAVTGAVNGGTAATITDTAAVTISGTVSAAAIDLTAASITIPGALITGGGVVNLVATSGGIDETGFIVAGTLTGRSAGPVSLLGQANEIASLGDFFAASFLLNDAEAVSLNGSITSGGAFVLTDTGNIVISQSGSINGNGVTITGGGDMSIAGHINGGSGQVDLTDRGVFSMTGAAGIASNTSIAINDTDVVTLGGLLSAPRIVVNNGGGLTSTLAGTIIDTGGEARPSGTLAATQLPSIDGSTGGFYVTTGQFTQTGTLTIEGANSVARIDAAGSITLGTLSGPGTWLILDLSNGGKATGNVNVRSLDVVFAQGQASGSQLTGTVGGQGGNAAAGQADIAPQTNGAFQINGCPIASINCVVLTTQSIPTGSPLSYFVIGGIFDPTDADDLLLPLVSDQEY